ncbi:MAG: hypothetical protein K8I03_14505, partial [Ignavibacteria bacterium]|nr:hypothetical protein [Ignavibacteria bacterium]
MRKIVVLYILLMICIGCNSSKDFEEQSKDKDKLIGDWERYGDEFAGAMIAVEYDKESDLLQGWLTYTTDSMITWNFRCYEIKWLDIEKEKNGYSFRDMYKKKHFYALLS